VEAKNGGTLKWGTYYFNEIIISDSDSRFVLWHWISWYKLWCLQ